MFNVAAAADPNILFTDQTFENLDKAMKSNVYAPWLMMQLCFPMMKEHGGSIINTSSGASNGSVGFSSYGASKSASNALTRTVALEWGKYGIRANNLMPICTTESTETYSPELQEMIRTSMIEGSPLGRVATQDDIAPVALFLACDDSRWITGQDLHAEGGTFIHD